MWRTLEGERRRCFREMLCGKIVEFFVPAVGVCNHQCVGMPPAASDDDDRGIGPVFSDFSCRAGLRPSSGRHGCRWFGLHYTMCFSYAGTVVSFVNPTWGPWSL